MFFEILVKLVINSKNKIEKVYVGGKGYYCEIKCLNIENIEWRVFLLMRSLLFYFFLEMYDLFIVSDKFLFLKI